jgi:hypothetical protein
MLQAISELVKAYGGPSLLAVIATALGWLARSVLPLWWDRQNKMQDRGWVLVEQRDREIILLRQALMRSSRREGALAAALDVMSMAMALPLEHQGDFIRGARRELEQSLPRVEHGGSA